MNCFVFFSEMGFDISCKLSPNNLHEMILFAGKIREIFQNVSAETFTQRAKCYIPEHKSAILVLFD